MKNDETIKSNIQDKHYESAEPGISRREFLVKAGLAGAWVSLTVSCAPMRRFLADTADHAVLPYNNKYDVLAWFEITADNQVILFSPKVEMGQGIFTGMAQMAAEELGVRYDQMKVVNANTQTGPIDPMSTGGSTSIAQMWKPVRELGAQMREMLKNHAAKIWDVPPNTLSVNEGIIEGNGKKMTFGEVVSKTEKWKIPGKVKLKDQKDFKLIGKPVPRIDLEDKVMGAPLFGMDVTMPDMLYGSVVRSPMVDAKRGKVDASKAEKMPGVIKVVIEDDFVGVVANTKPEAEMAARSVKVEWIPNQTWQLKDVREMTKVGKGKSYVIQKEGNPGKHLKDGPDLVYAEYSSPIGAHAQIEPNGAVVHVHGDKATVRMSTQVVKITRAEIADRLGIKEKDVEFQATYLGGGFGRRLHTKNAVQAAVMSKATGKPVHVFFSRRDEFFMDTFRPPTHHVMMAKLNSDGSIKALEHNTSSGAVAFGSPMVPGFAEPVLGADIGAWRGGMILYHGIPNYRTVSWKVDLPFATSWWRGLGLLANSFAVESFMDELAVSQKKDPIEFRLAHLSGNPKDSRNQQLRKVIEAVRDASPWNKKLPEGHALGFAACVDANTPCAQIVQLSVENKTEIKVHKVWCAIDPKVVVNPDGVKAQCEGGIIMGLSASLYEEMGLTDNVIAPTNYGAYQIAMLKNAPKEIETIILESGGDPTGVGEPPIGPIGAAIANAVFRLTGQRLRDMPLRLSS